MEENNVEMVFVTQCGKKFHFDPKCSYIKAKSTKKVPYTRALLKFGGPCSRCLNYRNPLNNRNNDDDNFNQNNYNNNNYLFFNKNNRNDNVLPYNNINQIYGNNYRKLNKENLNIINNNIDQEDKKIDDLNEDYPLEQNNNFSDFLMLSSSASILAGGGIDLKKKISLENSEIDFNNNKYCTINKNEPMLENNMSSIMNNDFSSEYDNFSNVLINKNLKIKEEENKCILKQIIEEEYEDNKITNDNKRNILHNKNIIRSENEIYDNNSNIFKIIDNQSNNKINNESSSNKSNNTSNKKDENAFFSDSKIININDSSNDHNICIIYNKDNSSNNIKLNNNNEKYISKSSSNNKLKNKKKKININENDDINIIKETNLNAKIISLDNSVLLSISTSHITSTVNFENNINNKNKDNYNSDNYRFDGIEINLDTSSFKFTFEINPKKKNKICTIIEVGFEVDFVDENDIDLLNDDDEEDNNPINNSDNNDNILDSVCQRFFVLRKFKIYKKTNIINVLINIDKGKFFIVGGKELNDINEKKFSLSKKNNLLYICNCQSVTLRQIRGVKPVLNYNKKDLYFNEIKINGKELENDFIE